MILPRALLALAAAIFIPTPDPPRQDDRALIQGKTIDAWVAALKDRDPATRKRAIEVVGEHAVGADVPAAEQSRLRTEIVSLISDKDEQVRKAAAFYSDLFRAAGSPEMVERLLEEHRRSVDPTRRVIRLLDAEGKPVAGAVASTFFWRDADHEPSFRVPEPTEAATSNARGLIVLKLEIPGHLDAAGLYAIRQDGGHPLVGATKVTREELDRPITVVMHPACRVRLRIECPGFRALEEKYHVQLGGDGWWRAAYVWLGTNHQTARPLFTTSTNGELEFLLPPGRYMIMAYGGDVKGVDRVIEVKPGHRVLNLGVVEVQPDEGITEGKFHGFWRSIRRDDQAGEERVTFRRPRLGPILKGDTRRSQDLAYSPDGKLLATAHAHNADPGEVKLWDPATAAALATFSTPDRGVVSVAFSPDGKLLAGLGLSADRRSSAVVLWDVASRRELRTLGGPAAPVSAMAFAPDARTLATIGSDRALRFWDVATGTEARRIDGVGSGRVLAFSPDGRTLVVNGAGGVPILWDVAGNRLRAALEPASEPFRLRSVSFAPDGRTLAVAGSVDVPGGQTGRARLYDLTRDPPARRAELSHHGEPPGGENQWASSIGFTPDGRRVVGVVMANAATIVIWDAATGHEMDSVEVVLGGPDDHLAVSPDGRWLAMTHQVGTGVTFLDIGPPGR
jgi:Tol biopolymer transport system component